jgi:RimJ/RimL family protein N-acetyltransferase
MIEIRDALQSDLDLVRQDSIDVAAKNYPNWDLNGWAKTALIDGQIIGVGGCVVYWEGVGEGWFCLSKKALEHKIGIFKCIQRIIEQAFLELKLKRMQVSERADSSQTIKMAEALGFNREGLMKSYLPDGTDAYLYALVRE